MATVRFLPAVDSAVVAAANGRNLAIPGEVAQRMAAETVTACDAGTYIAASGTRVDIADAVASAIRSKTSIPPDAALPPAPTKSRPEMLIEVTNETTTSAAQRLQATCTRVAALNFANGRVPGGGFLSGARAQEEALCRMSALYPTLVGDVMYAHHAHLPEGVSSSWAILSPDVPFFRDEASQLLDEPWLLSIITCAAPVAWVVEQARDMLDERIHRVLAIGEAYGFDGLVLGAWGCGAFGNDPTATASDFRTALTGPFAGAFRHVMFAVADLSQGRTVFGPFRDAFTDDEP
jgi:uncharacterized protein (TIGR02452 family)